MTAKPRKPLLVNLVWAGVLSILLPVLYVLSYAPAARIIVGTGVWEANDPKYDPMIVAYKPLLVWMWESQFSKPLIWRWADLWGVHDVAEVHAWIAVGSPVD